MISNKTGPGSPLVWIMILGAISACSAKPASKLSSSDDIKEMRALVSATERHPSLVDRADFAGPAIHVSPYLKSAGNAHHMMASATHPKTSS